MKLDTRHEITTEHPASHYGAGVLLIDDAMQPAYGPDDPYPESCPELVDLLGAPHQNCAEMMIYLARRVGMKDDEQIRKWLAQSPRAADYFKWLAR